MNLKVLDKLQNEQIEEEQSQLVNIGSCDLRTLQLGTFAHTKIG